MSHCLLCSVCILLKVLNSFKMDFLKGRERAQQLRILRVEVIQATNLAKKDVFGLR